MLLNFVFCLILTSAYGQFGGRGGGVFGRGGPKLTGVMTKLFGDNPTFTADLQMEAADPGGDKVSTPAKLAYDKGFARFEIDLSQIKSASMPAEAAEQMKAMGMDKMIIISRPDKQHNLMIYPGLNAYAQMPLDDEQAADGKEDVKLEMTELGRETVDGHPTIKNKAVLTDAKGEKYEATVWNATDLKKFPVKIEQKEKGTPTVLSFKNVAFTKPDAKQFEPPAGATKYDDMQTMIQQEMMKKMGGGVGGLPAVPPGGPPRK